VAGDLIPPPSPAGRPPPDPVLEPRAGRAPEAPAPPPAPAEPTPRPYRARFGFVFGALAGVAVCAAALAVTLTSTGSDFDPHLAPNWSQWTPTTGDMLVGAEDIAAYVGDRYKLDDGEELVRVKSSGMELQDLSVAVRPSGGTIEFLDGDGVIYVLDGLGPQGMLARGKRSEERGRLLRREALELALYSFRYLDDATMVAVLMPPTLEDGESAAGSTGQPALRQQAVFFRPGDLLPLLQVPLGQTLVPTTPRPKTVTAQEAARIDALTLGNLFIASFEQAQDGGAYLLLSEPSGLE
jgi:hypothetical protein